MGCLWSLQVLQACVLRLAKNCWIRPEALKEAFLLPTVCRRAPHLSTLEAATSLQQPSLGPDARGRRIKEALEQPFWSELEGALAARLWRALERPGAPLPLLYGVKRFILLLMHKARLEECNPHSTEHCLSAKVDRLWLHQRPLAAAGTPEEASARRWLEVQGGAVKCVSGLSIGQERCGTVIVPGRDLDAAQLSTLLASLPALTSIGWLMLRADLHRSPTRAAIRAFLAGAARAIARCASLQTLSLRISLVGGLAGQLPKALVRELASVRSLEDVSLDFEACEANRPDWPVTFSLAHLVAGLAGLTRLRTLILTVRNVCMEATLPASVSRLAQLNYLGLRGFHGLRCEPGWARLPALARLNIVGCEFAGDGEAALPGMDALGALTSLDLHWCPSLRLLPTSLWRLSQLRCLSHHPYKHSLAGVPRSALPVPGLPLGAPCFASLTHLTLAGYNLHTPPGGAPYCFASLTHLTLAGHSLRAFPPCILGATRLTHLDLSRCCFEQLPEGVSALTGLEDLHLGWPAPAEDEVGGSVDARALGSLAAFPHLRSLCLENCSLLFCSDFQAAAAHPSLERLTLWTAYPDSGPSCAAFLGFACALLKRGRARVLCLAGSSVQGAGRGSSSSFRAALAAMGPPFDVYAYSSDEESADEEPFDEEPFDEASFDEDYSSDEL